MSSVRDADQKWGNQNLYIVGENNSHYFVIM